MRKRRRTKNSSVWHQTLRQKRQDIADISNHTPDKMCCRVAVCCCITDLQLATLLIAILSMVGNAGLVAFTAWLIKQTRLLLLILLNNAASGEDALIPVRALRVSLAILVVILLVCIAAVLLDIVLLFGAISRRRDLVQCWTHGHAVVSGAYLLYFWMAVVGLFADGYIVHGILFLGATIIGAVVTVYFWVVVRSYDLKLQGASVSTVAGDCAPSVNNGYDPASTRPSASWETDKPITGSFHSSPPYRNLP